uniref:Uncharacterized protein n=1 Tax=Oryza punctata TaxID=4537 RepID=A0A0E0L716_ORYPU
MCRRQRETGAGGACSCGRSTQRRLRWEDGGDGDATRLEAYGGLPSRRLPFCSLTLSLSNPTTWIELKCTGGRDSALMADRWRGVGVVAARRRNSWWFC